MVKKLTKTGNSLALVLDRPLLEATGIDADTSLEISTDGDVIVITPVRDERRAEKLRSGVEKINARYAGVFQKLAE
ncbi:MAG: AbrB/MazE/SpoVT family DNA-binding domain-containing protein [Acidobacteriota bacterium]|nr:AbrB/MazE/SpoVT family DNA-binding domain-containing protein [Acidobacteriota bacterium]